MEALLTENKIDPEIISKARDKAMIDFKNMIQEGIHSPSEGIEKVDGEYSEKQLEEIKEAEITAIFLIIGNITRQLFPHETQTND